MRKGPSRAWVWRLSHLGEAPFGVGEVLSPKDQEIVDSLLLDLLDPESKGYSTSLWPKTVAGNSETRSLFLEARIPLYLFPFLNTTSEAKSFKYLHVTSLGVLAKVDDTEVVNFLLKSEAIPLCLRIMGTSGELSKTVTISLETMVKGAYRQVMSKLVSEKRHTELGGRLLAYDGRNLLFAASELPFKTNEFESTLSGRTERTLKVLIKHAASVSLCQLMMLMAGYQTDIPGHSLQAVGIMLNEHNNMEYIAAGRSYFSPVIDTVNLGPDVEGWKGFY